MARAINCAITASRNCSRRSSAIEKSGSFRSSNQRSRHWRDYEGDYCYYESPLKRFGRVTMAAIRIPRRALSSPAAWPLCETDRESGLLPINSYLLDRCTCTCPMRHDSASRYRFLVQLICSRSIANCVLRSRHYCKNVVTTVENLSIIQYIDFSSLIIN